MICSKADSLTQRAVLPHYAAGLFSHLSDKERTIADAICVSLSKLVKKDNSIEDDMSNTLNTYAKDEIAKKCNGLGLNRQQTTFCIHAFGLDRLSEVELADMFSIEVQSVRNKKMYYKKKLMSTF